MGSCTSSHLDAPADFRGKVYALQAGQCVTHDRDLGSGWKHLAAVRRDGRLELFVDGLKTAESPALSGSPLDVTNGQTLRLGAGETDSFSGLIQEVRMYRRALSGETLRRLADEVAHETFVFAFRHLHKFDLQRPFRPWLRGIAWQLVRAQLQRFAREQVNRSRLEQLQLAELLAEAAQPAPPEEATFLEECLAETPPHLRRLIEDRYRHERTVREIAAFLRDLAPLVAAPPVWTVTEQQTAWLTALAAVTAPGEQER